MDAVADGTGYVLLCLVIDWLRVKMLLMRWSCLSSSPIAAAAAAGNHVLPIENSICSRRRAWNAVNPFMHYAVDSVVWLGHGTYREVADLTPGLFVAG